MKKLLSGILLSMLFSSTAMAETVVVTGSGSTRDAAINDAKRNAIEKVVGSHVSSTTIVDNLYVLKDEIYSKAYGYVTDIEILQETQGAIYEVQARVNVDSSPDSQLMNKLENLRMMNNPRIAVVVKHNTSGNESTKYINLCETIITQRLRELGFSKMIDKAKIWQRKNEGRGEFIISKTGVVQPGVMNDSGVINASSAEKTVDGSAEITIDSENATDYMPESVNEPEKQKEKLPPLPKPGPIDYEAYLPNSDTDYFIFGSLEFSTGEVMHPVFKDLREEVVSNFATGFQKTSATLEIKILKSDTMEQVDIHSVEASVLHSNQNVAEREAVQKVASKAAEKIAESFAKKNASIETGFELQVRSEYENLDTLLLDLQKVSGIRNVHLRNYQGGKACYEIEGDIKPFDLFKQMQQSSRFRITKINLSDNLLEIMVV